MKSSYRKTLFYLCLWSVWHLSLLIGQELVDRMTCQLAFLRKIASIIVMQLAVKMRSLLAWLYSSLQLRTNGGRDVTLSNKFLNLFQKYP